jgi:hypothetical protein
MVQALVPFIPAAILTLINTGLQVSGFTNFPLAVSLWCLAGLLAVIPAWHYRAEWKARIKSAMPSASTTLIIGLAIIIAGVLVTAVGAFQQYHAPAIGGGDSLAATGTVSDPDISWNFNDVDHPAYFIAMVQTAGQEIIVLGIQAHGKNNRNEPISEISGFVRSDITNRKLPINLLVYGDNNMPEPVPPQDTYGIPPLAEFDITTVSVPIANPAVDGTPLSKFVVEFASFSLEIQYDSKKIVRHFSKEEVRNQFALFEDVTQRNKSTVPRVTRKPKT